VHSLGLTCDPILAHNLIGDIEEFDGLGSEFQEEKKFWMTFGEVTSLNYSIEEDLENTTEYQKVPVV
jgi:hypothetical protein